MWSLHLRGSYNQYRRKFPTGTFRLDRAATRWRSSAISPCHRQAYIGKNVARGNGFVPFEGLSTDERYVEVLGHELAHVVAIFSNLERARQVDQLIVPTNEMFYADHAKKPNSPLGADLEHRINLRDRLLDELEVDADAAEEAVWRELITVRRQRR